MKKVLIMFLFGFITFGFVENSVYAECKGLSVKSKEYYLFGNLGADLTIRNTTDMAMEVWISITQQSKEGEIRPWENGPITVEAKSIVHESIHPDEKREKFIDIKFSRCE